MNGLIKKLFGIKDESKPEVVASFHFLCNGMNHQEYSTDYSAKSEVPATQIIMKDGSAKVFCPRYKELEGNSGISCKSFREGYCPYSAK
jgi:hypothetical protein